MLDRYNYTIGSFVEKSFSIVDDTCYPAEPELYGSYIKKYHKNMYLYKALKSRPFGKKQDDPRESVYSVEEISNQIEKMSRTDLDVISMHSWCNNNDGNLHGKLIDQSKRDNPRKYIDLAIHYFRINHGSCIVEIGSMRQNLSHKLDELNHPCCNDGHSTALLARLGVETYSVDIDPAASEITRNVLKSLGFTHVEVLTDDGLHFLMNFKKKIDFLYLDAWDADKPGSASKHLRAYEICRDKLSDQAIILIDDTDVDFQDGQLILVGSGGGKGKALIPAAIKDGFEMIFSGRQTLLVKRKSLTLKEPHGKHPVIARGESKGDAFSIKKPVITMSSLGKNGRFANQVFQYAFLKIFAKKYGYQVETPRWIGKSLFGCSDPLASRQYAMITEEDNNFLTNEPSYDKSLMDGVDFWGYFQYHTSYYALYKDYFRSLFQPVSEIKAKLDYALNVLRSKGKIIVGMHLRRSDYGYGYYFIAPNKWYKDWLAGFWDILEDPILFIASDESEKVASEFSEYNPLTLKDLNIRLQELEFYADFYLLSCCDAMAISNSSFSFAAAMLNEHCRFFFRPHLPTGKLIPFDPWDSLVLFKDARTEDYELKEIALPPNVFANQGPGGNNEYFQDIKNRKNGAMKDYGSTELEKVNEMFQQGCSLISSGDTDGALDILLKVHELDPGHASACHLIGMLYDAQDDMDKAMVYLDQAVRLNPCSISFNKTLADAYFFRKGSVETAMQIYLNILNAYPEDVETLLAIGDVCMAVNKPNEGAVFFKRVLEIDNRNVSAKQRLAAINKTATSTG